MIGMGLRCLDSSRSPSTYVLALKAYAMALAKVPNATTVVEELMNKAIESPTVTYWEGRGKNDT